MDIAADLQKLVSGDTKTWQRFVARFNPYLYSAVRKTYGAYLLHFSDEEVEDVVQECYAKLVNDEYRLLRTFDERKARFSTWLTLIAKSTAIDHLRRRKEHLHIDHEPALCETPCEEIENVEIPPALLTPRQQMTLHLLYERELEVSEAAAVMRVSEQTVRSMKHKALARLRTYFKESE